MQFAFGTVNPPTDGIIGNSGFGIFADLAGGTFFSNGTDVGGQRAYFGYDDHQTTRMTTTMTWLSAPFSAVVVTLSPSP